MYVPKVMCLSGITMTGQSFPSLHGLCMYLFWWHLKSKWARGWFNSAPAYEACVHRDVSEVLGGGRGRGRAEMGHRQTWLCRLCYIICLLGGPELFVLFASEALVVVAFAFEQLLKVGFTVEFTLKGCEGAKAAEGRTEQRLHTKTKGVQNKYIGKKSVNYI